MKSGNFFLRTTLFLSVVIYSQNLHCKVRADNDDNRFQNAIVIRPIDLFLSIYIVQYERKIGLQNEIVAGLYEIKNNSNSEYPGYYQLISPIIGYRWYFWKGLHLEYSLLPGYAKYNYTIRKETSKSFEIWNEFHLGYKFQFKIFKLHLFLTPQVLLGFNLYKSNEPSSFEIIDNKKSNFYPNKIYLYPNINLGINF
jgi:hypothetical protein